MNKYLKRLLILTLPAFLVISCKTKKQETVDTIFIDSAKSANQNPYLPFDQSQMDMSYFPGNYPLQKMSGNDSSGNPQARILYSRPHKKQRNIFGSGEKSLVKYGQEWRLGANEATEIEFFTDVTIQGHALARGRYVMYCIPFQDHWTIVFNTNLYTWGLHMDPSKDIFRTDIPVMELMPPVEDFTMVFLPATHGTDLLMAWDNVKALLPVTFK